MHRSLLQSGTFIAILLLFLGLNMWYASAEERVQVSLEEGEEGEEGEDESTQAVNLSFQVDRSSLPALNYYSLTYNVYIGDAAGVQVTAGGDSIPYSAVGENGYIRFTTDQTAFEINLSGVSAGSIPLGDYYLSPLKDHKSWSWGHGMDDNGAWLEPIAMFERKGMPVTLYIISQMVKDVNDPDFKPNPDDISLCDDESEAWQYECYAIAAPKLRELQAKGWAIGNHSTNHDCWSDVATLKENMLEAEQDIRMVPNYVVTSFAAPCGYEPYHPAFLELKGEGRGEMIFNEHGFANIVNENYQFETVIPVNDKFDFTLKVPRDGRLDCDEADPNGTCVPDIDGIIEKIEWLHANSNPDGDYVFHLSTLSHGRAEIALETVIDYIEERYGKNGTNEAWLTTTEEVYSYLMVRDNATISVQCEGGSGSQLCVSLPTPVATATIDSPSATPTMPTFTPSFYLFIPIMSDK